MAGSALGGKGIIMGDWILIIGWGSPIGIGIFLICIATMVFILAKAGAVKNKEKK